MAKIYYQNVYSESGAPTFITKCIFRADIGDDLCVGSGFCTVDCEYCDSHDNINFMVDCSFMEKYNEKYPLEDR